MATSANTTGHCRMFQVHTNARPRPANSATFSASAGPPTTSVIEARMKIARPTVRPMATSRTFHHGRPSVMSYAVLSVEHIETTAPELLHSVKRNAIVRSPPALSPEISFI